MEQGPDANPALVIRNPKVLLSEIQPRSRTSGFHMLRCAAYGEVDLLHAFVGGQDDQFDPVFIGGIDLVKLVDYLCPGFFEDECADI